MFRHKTYRITAVAPEPVVLTPSETVRRYSAPLEST